MWGNDSLYSFSLTSVTPLDPPAGSNVPEKFLSFLEYCVLECAYYIRRINNFTSMP